MKIGGKNPSGGKTGYAIWLRTLGTLVGYVGSALAVYHQVFKPLFENDALALALTFFSMQCVGILSLLIVLLSRKLAKQITERRAQKLYPLMRGKLAEYIIGDDALIHLQTLQHNHPAEFETCLSDFLPSLRGEAGQRLSRLAVELGLVERWQKQLKSYYVSRRQSAITHLGLLAIPVAHPLLLAALDDDEMEVRLEACRTLIRSAQTQELDRVFHFALTQPLTVRAVLVVELRPYALQLAQSAIPTVLREGDERSVIRTLEIIAAWHKALPLPEIAELIRHRQPKIRVAALCVVPYIVGNTDLAPSIREALTSENSQVKSAAAWVIGRLKIEQALPDLLVCLRNPDAEVANASAQALGELGANGVEILEREILSPRQTAATAALEVLQRVRTSRGQFARL